MKNKEKHEFALFLQSLSSIIKEKEVGDIIVLSDENIVHRIMHVLRLEVQNCCILFDRFFNVLIKLESFIGKKNISVSIQSIKKNNTLKPEIIFLLPLLKRDDYESALYALTEVGITSIQLVFTQKTTHQWSGLRDRERAQRILISAAEQSKNFAYPELKDPIPLHIAVDLYKKENTTKIFFDAHGKKLSEVMHAIQEKNNDKILLLIGPEGDLVLEEKKMVQANNFIFCALTPTVIRAVQAAALGAGFIRSIL